MASVDFLTGKTFLNSILIFGLSVAFLILSVSTDDYHQSVVYAVAGQQVQLKCPLPMSKPLRVEWFDYVYNNDVRPLRIASISGNRTTIDRNHPNREKYAVDENTTLVISDVKLDDVGAYFCRSRNDGRSMDKHYYLAIAGNHSCNGTTTMLVGQTGSYTCESQFTGNYQPSLEWVRLGTHGPWPSVDHSDVRLVKKVFDLEASAGDDGTTFACQMTFGNSVKECHVNVTVQYLVRDLVIDPHKGSLSVGEEIRCSANGNPTPTIAFNPALTPGKTGVGWLSATVPKTLRDQTVQLECIASNSVNGATEELRKAISFTVTGSETEEKEDEAGHVRSEAASSSGAIVGGIVVGIMILAIIVAVIFCLRLRKDKQPKKDENGEAKTTTTASRNSSTQIKENQV